MERDPYPTAGYWASNRRYLLVIPIALGWIAPWITISLVNGYARADPVTLSGVIGLLIAGVVSGLSLIYALGRLNSRSSRLSSFVLYLIVSVVNWVGGLLAFVIGAMGMQRSPGFEDVPLLSGMIVCVLTPFPLVVSRLAIADARRQQNSTAQQGQQAEQA